jgi:hypothetical protein
MKFRLIDAETGGNEVWFETWTTSTEMVTTTKGLFSVMLGKHNPLSNINFFQPLYLEVQYDPGCDGTYEEVFSPRKPLGAVSASFEAKKLLGYDWASPGIIGATNPNEAYFTKLTVSATSTLSTTTISGVFAVNNNLLYVDPASGRIGIGTSTPAFTLDVSGNLRATNYVRSETGFCIGDNCITSWGSAVSYWTLTGNYLYPNDLSWNVGIGTSTPAEKLTVEGNILATGNLTVQGLTSLSTTTISAQLTVATITSPSSLTISPSSNATTTITGPVILASETGNVGIGTATPAYKLDVSGNLRVSGQTIFGGVAYTWPSSAGSSGQVLTTDGTGNLSWTSVAGGVSGSGTQNYLAKWTATTTLGNSIITDDGSLVTVSGQLQTTGTTTLATSGGNVGIRTTTPAYTLDIAGPLRLIPNSQPTGANGVIYYDSALDKFRCYQGGAWTDCIGYSPMRDVIIVEEFVSGLTTSGNIGDLGWLMAAGSVTGQAPSEEKIGILRLSSPATANTRGVLQLSPGTAGVMIIPGRTGDIHIKMVVRNAQAAASACTIRIGLLNTNAAGEASDAIMFRASGTGNWTAVTRAGGTETATNCGVAQTTTFKTFEILINPAFNQVTFIIDGVTCATHTTNIPTVALSPTFKVDTTAATAYSIDIDRFVMVRSPLIRGSDLAEYYYTKDDSIEPGDVVSVDGMILAGVKKSERPYDEKVLGVISTEPGMILGGTSGEGRAVLVALSGRVPVKVSNENGEIKPGDLLTSSNIPGVAIKATEPGRVIGMALESSEKCEREKLEKGECKILMFVNPHWSLGSLTEEGDLSGSKKAANNEQRTILDQFTLAIKRALEKLGLLIENGVAKIEKIFAKEIVVEKIKSEEIETTRIKIKDKATGEIYCLWIENGEIRKGKGDCISLTSQPTTDKTSQPKTEGLQETTDNQQQNLEKESQTSTETTTTPTDEKVIEQSNRENVQESQ